MSWKSIVCGVACSLTMATSAVPAAEPEVLVVESPESDLRVTMTDMLESFGLDLQDAHDFAVLANDGIVLEEESSVCLTYLITLWWCENQDGSDVVRTMRFRMEEACFAGFFSPPGGCKDAVCPPGTKRYFSLRSGEGLCLGVPKNACVHMEVTGPVESSCSSMPSCQCLRLSETTCEQSSRCVPITGAPATVVPSDCPQCN